MIAEEKPDLVLCDVNMPAMSGYETLAAVRESSQTATIPFILMTGLVSREVFAAGMVCGADDYLVKPFTADELIEAVMSRPRAAIGSAIGSRQAGAEVARIRGALSVPGTGRKV